MRIKAVNVHVHVHDHVNVHENVREITGLSEFFYDCGQSTTSDEYSVASGKRAHGLFVAVGSSSCLTRGVDLQRSRVCCAIFVTVDVDVAVVVHVHVDGFSFGLVVALQPL
ncbi:MAG TPA: hypothetical protein VGQ81_03955 [Acidobacteriota bacterium]|nr:hypothetical protein [Acidobacteriota bacterium]